MSHTLILVHISEGARASAWKAAWEERSSRSWFASSGGTLLTTPWHSAAKWIGHCPRKDPEWKWGGCSVWSQHAEEAAFHEGVDQGENSTLMKEIANLINCLLA